MFPEQCPLNLFYPLLQLQIFLFQFIVLLCQFLDGCQRYAGGVYTADGLIIISNMEQLIKILCIRADMVFIGGVAVLGINNPFFVLLTSSTEELSGIALVELIATDYKKTISIVYRLITRAIIFSYLFILNEQF